MSARSWALIVILALASVAAADGAAVETRTFSGEGSAGVESEVELYLPGGEYRHALQAAPDCFVTGGLFPAEREPRAKLSDVIRADLHVGEGRVTGPRAEPEGSFIITTPGWVVLQLGTGPECRWDYTITGAFVPEGDEPRAPLGQEPIGLTLPLVVGLLAVVAIVAVARRRRGQVSEVDDEPAVRVTPPEAP